MAWNSDPMVRELGAYCDKHGIAMGVLFGLEDNGDKVRIVTYGQNAKLCKVAKHMGDQTWKLIQAGEITPESSPG